MERSSREADAATLITVLAALPLIALATAVLAAASWQSPGTGRMPATSEPVIESAAPTSRAAVPAVPALAEPIVTESLPATDSSPPPHPVASGSAALPARLPAPEDRTDSAHLLARRSRESKNGPLIEAYDKEAYNTLTELKAAIESEAWEDAARIVTALDPAQAPGLAPWIDDPLLAVSLPVAAQLAHESYPQLRLTLGEQFTALAKLRLADAKRTANAGAIELATTQFAGTSAAAAAHQWLGDQALIAGWFSRAIQQYERARSGDPTLEAEVAPRIRLAAAMIGRDLGAPATAGVQFGDVSLSAGAFEALIAEMKGREGAADAAVVASDYSRLPSTPASAAAEPLTASLTNGNVQYVTNQLQVTAFDLATGERLWESEKLPGQTQRGQEWAMTRMRPLVQGERFFVRLLSAGQPRLVCLEKSSGQLLWIAESREREYVVSDPLWVQGHLVALSLAPQPDQQGMLRYAAFDLKTGQTLRQRELVRLRNTWSEHSCCEVAGHDDGLVAVLGGATLAVDGIGNVRWVRKSAGSQAAEDPQRARRVLQQPLVAANRVYVAQPGISAVECLDAATGRQLWSVYVPELVGLVGLEGDQLAVQTDGRVLRLAAADGSAVERQ